MIHELASFLNQTQLYQVMQLLILLLALMLAIAGFIVGFECAGLLGEVIMLSTIIIGLSVMCCSGGIVEQLNSGKLQTEINSKMQVIDNKYPYQLSITDSNDNVYFVFCKTKDSQNKVIKTMNTGDNPTIKYSNDVATYINISQHIENGTQVEKQIKEKDLLDIMKNNFN